MKLLLRLIRLMVWLNVLVWAAVLCMILFSSCTAEKKLSRLAKKHPQLVTTKTVVVADTTIFKAIRSDSAFTIRQITHSVDTVVIRNDSIIHKYFYNHTTDSLYFIAECPERTRIKKIPVKVETWKEIEVMPKWVWGLIVFTALLLLLMALSAWAKGFHR